MALSITGLAGAAEFRRLPGDVGAEVGDLAVHLVAGDSEFGSQEVGDAGCGLGGGRGVQEAGRDGAGEDVGDRAGNLVPDGEHRHGGQIGQLGHQPFGEHRIGDGEL